MHRRDLGARREQRDVDAAEIEAVEVLDLEDMVLAVGDLAARRALGGDRGHVPCGSPALGEDVQHLTADIAGGAHHRYLKAHEPVSGERRFALIRHDLRRGARNDKGAVERTAGEPRLPART